MVVVFFVVELGGKLNNLEYSLNQTDLSSRTVVYLYRGPGPRWRELKTPRDWLKCCPWPDWAP